MPKSYREDEEALALILERCCWRAITEDSKHILSSWQVSHLSATEGHYK